MGVPLDEAIRVRCPLCEAGPNKPCFTVRDGILRVRPRLHQERIQAAGRERHVTS